MKVIILAAGKSERYKGHKTLALLNGRVLISYALEELSDFSPIVMIGAYINEMKKFFENDFRHIQLVENRDYELGLGSSVYLALLTSYKEKEDLLLTLGDLPHIKKQDYLKIIHHAQETQNIVFSSYQEKGVEIVTPPVYIPYLFQENLLQKLEDTDLKIPLKRLADLFVSIEIPSASKDYDYPEDFD